MPIKILITKCTLILQCARNILIIKKYQEIRDFLYLVTEIKTLTSHQAKRKPRTRNIKTDTRFPFCPTFDIFIENVFLKIHKPYFCFSNVIVSGKCVSWTAQHESEITRKNHSGQFTRADLTVSVSTLHHVRTPL